MFTGSKQVFLRTKHPVYILYKASQNSSMVALRLKICLAVFDMPIGLWVVVRCKMKRGKFFCNL